MLKNYKELKVWQRSYQLCLKIYKVTTIFPKEERYGLTSQIRRSAVSILRISQRGMGGRQLQIISGIYTLPKDQFVSWRLRYYYLGT